MPSCVAHVVKIIVLATGAHAALTGGGSHVVTTILAREHILELDHARVGEQQGSVAVSGKVVEKPAADLGGREHGASKRLSEPTSLAPERAQVSPDMQAMYRPRPLRPGSFCEQRLYI